MSDAYIPSPVDVSWRDDLQAATDAALVLKLSPTGPDFDRLYALAQSAGELICLHLDRYEPIPGTLPQTPPPPLRFAHSHVTIELWRRKDAPFGVLNAWSTDDVAVRIGNDPLAGIIPVIEPYRSHWGLG